MLKILATHTPRDVRADIRLRCDPAVWPAELIARYAVGVRERGKGAPR